MTEVGKNVCSWVANDNGLYLSYHNEQWGVPVYDDTTLFEMITLEGAQAGLSWITILKRRDSYRAAFDRFDPAIVANYSEEKVKILLNDSGIIRNRLKIISAVNNAAQFLKIQEEFGSFTSYLWKFVNGKPIVNTFKTFSEIPAYTELSDTISHDMKKRGFTFFGTTICYAFMQAVGIVNDHQIDCFRHKEIAEDTYRPRF
ncbi:MAG: DNA-3-methyladenine glycosylase I [Nitrospirae bacterium]|nr:DNA-3-methyladenine glycosylase I [Nitrospirota bacterium]MBF0533667.1 DNA-3-methyladenine glycosylase I [Nitrospirota bacterium]MBF0616682.1 DNA-3-methyladenine glycosylase I [Nitrospirota bacterium]